MRTKTEKQDKNSETKTDFRYLYAFIFIIFAFYLTAVKNDFYLKWAESFSLFLTTPEYFTDCMQSAGGLLTYGGAFFTQFFYYPVLGSCIFIALLFLIQYLTVVAFRIPRKYYALSFIPGLMLLLSVTQLGYVWLTLKSPGYLFSNTLGFIVFLLCFMGYKKMTQWWVRAIALLIFIIAGYPLLGFYCLFTVLVCLLYEIITFFKEKNVQHFIPVIFGIVAAVCIPQMFFYKVYNNMQHFYVYTSGLPRFAFDLKELVLWLPFIVLFVGGLLLLIFFELKKECSVQRKTPVIFTSVVFIVAILFTYFMSFRDENFRAEIKMNAAIEENNWKKVITIAHNLRGAPTQNIILDYHLALTMLNKSTAKKFKQKKKVNSVRSVLPIITADMGGRTLLYKTGGINDCYRWCMEDMVEYRMRISTLKYLVKCAILNEEYELARKYNALISKTLFYKKWAHKYQTYIDNPELVKEDNELKVILYMITHDELMPEIRKKGFNR